MTVRQSVAASLRQHVSMPRPRVIVFTALVFAVCAGAWGIAAPDQSRADFSRSALNQRAPVVKERTYTLKAGVRLLLFWVRRDNVGSARLTWRAGAGDHRILEFLVGSDPDRAPRHINRWGFIAEEVRAHDADLLGVMSKSDEQSLEDAQSRTGADDHDADHPYVAIRTAIRNGAATGGVFRVRTREALTYRDLDVLLRLIPGDARPSRTVQVPTGTRPGFLFAVEDLVTSTLDQCRTGLHVAAPAVPYIYNGTFYTLKLRDCDFSSTRTIGDRVFRDVIRATFATHNTVTGNETTFRLEYGTAGDVKAVPLRIVFRPKWWFEAELRLDAPPPSPPASR